MSQYGLTAEEIKEFREIFDMVDVDRGGSISKEELEGLMRTLGLNPSKEELEAMILEIDQDGNGEIDFEEFVAVMAKKVNLAYSQQDVMSAFKLFEVQEERSSQPSLPGTISYVTLENALCTYGKVDIERITDLLSTMEFDENGRINYQEYVNMMMSG